VQSKQSLKEQADKEDAMATRLIALARRAEEQGNQFLAQSYQQLAHLYRAKATELHSLAEALGQDSPSDPT
jgi:hypothetical protein